MLVVWLVAPEVPVIRTLNLPFGVLLPVKSVSTEFAPLLPGITLDGEKLQLAPVGSPEQDSATVELTAALIGVMVTINWTEFPGFTLAALGFSEMEKSTPVPLRLTFSVFVVMVSEPVTASVPDLGPSAVGVKVTLKTQELPPGTPAEEQLFV